MEQLRRDQMDRLIAPLSNALDDWGIMPDDDDPPPRPLPELEAAIERARQLRAVSEYATLAQETPALLAETSCAVLLHASPGRDRERAHWLQAEAAIGAFSVAYKFGYMDLARLALSRMAMAAPQSGDPRQVAAERLKRAQLSAEGPALEQGLRLVRQGLRDLESDGTTETRAMRGGLLLKGGQLTALRTGGQDADEWFDEARVLAEELGETDCYMLAFGPTNVAQHVVAAAGDHDEHGRAVQLASEVRLPAGYSAARSGQFWIDYARSLALTARRDEAITALERARRVSPLQTRYHATTRLTMGVLLRARGQTPPRVRTFAQWSGV